MKSTFLLNHSLKAINSLLSSAQSKLPKNISTLLSGILTTHSQLAKISHCGFSHKRLTAPFVSSQSLFSTLLQAVTLILKKAASHGDMALRLTSWPHHSNVSVTLLFMLSPYLRDLRPDMFISTSCNTLYVSELSIGFETNLNKKTKRKFTKYRYLQNDLSSKYRHVKFLSISSLGIFGQS